MDGCANDSIEHNLQHFDCSVGFGIDVGAVGGGFELVSLLNYSVFYASIVALGKV